ncbi:hypothetical protein MUA95_02390 [Staphylococcus agnetis]|uniref:Uncharacterized protein n=1 Tax=Staphylococcus agnetis TaxID=985762 RepID=A0ABD7TUP5_9STAP|nr:hypothetical protein [Staphylococcus agnetis]UXU57679.1 hypothetical protein MUA95_02390 [Staphylococcus agnetis]
MYLILLYMHIKVTHSLNVINGKALKYRIVGRLKRPYGNHHLRNPKLNDL